MRCSPLKTLIVCFFFCYASADLLMQSDTKQELLTDNPDKIKLTAASAFCGNVL